MPTDDWQDVMGAIKGEYENMMFDDQDQQGTHFVTISGIDSGKVKWTNEDGEEYELTQDAEDPLKFTVDDEAHDVTVMPCIGASGGVCGVYGANGELYTKTNH